MMRRIHIWTPEEIEKLREFYATTRPAAELATELGVSVRSVYSKAQSLGLKKPEIYRSIAGKKGTQSPLAIAHRFRPGNIPYNKGKKMPSEKYAKCAPTMFKKGNQPANHRPVGSERVNVDGYVEVKVAEPNRWRAKHRIIWEEANGPIPNGCNIQFKDGNRLNVALNNLYVITRAEQLKTQNSLTARYPQELIDVIRLKGAIRRQIKIHNRKNKDE